MNAILFALITLTAPWRPTYYTSGRGEVNIEDNVYRIYIQDRHYRKVFESRGRYVERQDTLFLTPYPDSVVVASSITAEAAGSDSIEVWTPGMYALDSNLTWTVYADGVVMAAGNSQRVTITRNVETIRLEASKKGTAEVISSPVIQVPPHARGTIVPERLCFGNGQLSGKGRFLILGDFWGPAVRWKHMRFRHHIWEDLT